MICSSAVLLVLALATRTPLRLAEKRDLGLAVFAGLVLAFHWTTFFQAIQVSSVAMGTITFSAFPLFLTVLEPLVFRERLRARSAVEAVLLLAGVLITLPPDALNSGAAAGAAWGMLSGLAYAVLSLANRHLSARYPARVICLYEQATAAVALLPAVLFWPGSWTAADLWGIGALGVVCTALAHSLYVTAQRRVPDLDWLTEHNNRVWGCSSTENVIYACKLGDATNWFSYRGTAADSYAVTVGSDGAFTGAATCMGYVLFFKENGLHKLYGTKPSDYQMSSIQCSGVAKGAHQSLCVINETLYYLSMDGVMAWDGSLPTKVSASLDEESLSHVTRAAAGGLVGRYYLHTESPGGQRLLVYDTEKGLWHEEDATGWAMCSTGRQLYLWDKEAIWAADGSREAGGEEDTVEYEAVTGDIGLGDPDDKYCSRVTVRLDAMERTVVTLWASFDGGEWQEMGRVDTRDRRVQVNLPFVPTRHDTMRLRLTGKGQIAVRSIAMTLSSSEGGRVSGGVPKR